MSETAEAKRKAQAFARPGFSKIKMPLEAK
jgi:hypothetical protein